MKDIKLGADVISRNSEKVGTVDRVIVDPETLDVDGIVVHEGLLFSTDRIIKAEMIERVDSEGTVRLNITAGEEDQLPELTSARFVEADGGLRDQYASMHHMAMPAAAGSVLLLSEPVDDRYAPAPDSPMRPAPTDPPNIVDRSNLPGGTTTLEEGTDVVDINGDKIGTVEEVIYDEADRLTGIVVGSGIVFTNRVHVKADWIESAGHESVVINRTADQVEKAGTVD